MRKGITNYYFVLMEMKANWKERIQITCSEEERKSISDNQNYQVCLRVDKLTVAYYCPAFQI